MTDVITLTDLANDKKHSTFFAEVVTGKTGGLSTGADISTSTNQVTGQVQKTLPQVLADLGMVVQTWTATSGGTLTNAAQVFLNDKVGSAGLGNYYAWSGGFPKVVAAGVDPAITAGFIVRTDAALRDELTSNASSISAISKVGVFDNITSMQTGLTEGGATLVSSVTVPSTGLSIPSYSLLEQRKGAIGFIGGSYYATGDIITKTGNATISLSNQDSSAGSATVDCIMYTDPAWPNGAVYPQKSTFKNLGLVGNSSSHNQAGIYILQGGGYTIDSVDVVNCVNGLWAKNAWLMDIRKLHTLGKIRCDGGTSWSLTDCWARGDTSRVGAYDFTALLYSTLNGCGSDGAVNSAYSFNSCRNVVLNGCGCEGAATITANAGTALAIGDNNNLTINGFTCVPVASQPIALITVGNNNNVEIHGWNSSFGINYDTDIYVYGNDSTVEIWSSKFKATLPVIQIAVGSTSKVILHTSDGNIRTYTAPTIAGRAAVESFYDHGTWTPTLTFNGGTTGITYTAQSGSWTKNGNEFVFNYRVSLSSKGSSSGIAYITGLPGVSLYDENAGLSLAKGITGGPFSGNVDANASIILINTNSATGMTNATDANFSNTTTLRGSLRIVSKDSVFG